MLSSKTRNFRAVSLPTSANFNRQMSLAPGPPLALLLRYPALAATFMPPTIFNFFGLRENPFKINPDPRFLFVTEQTRATADELTYAIRNRKGLILLTGEVGTGKTMMVRRLLDWLAEQKTPTALIFNSHIKPEHSLDLILNDFGITCPSNLKSDKLLALQRWLLDRYRAGQTPVLIVDEAQGLEPVALEEIRLLLNFETPREKLLQIVLAGQPELEIQLKRHELRQLRQRITIRCRTASLTLDQTHGYIRERLRIAGASGSPIFEPDAVGSIHAYSRGIPRVINFLCEHSLVNACAEGVAIVTPAIVEQAAQDCQLDHTDSIARILNTGSYSTTTLADIGSILSTISAGSDADAPPVSQQQSLGGKEPGPVRPACRPPFQPLPSPAPAATRAFSENPITEPAGNQQASSTAAATYHVQVSAEPVETLSDIPPVRYSAPRRVPHHFARMWYRSFVADARSSWRKVRRSLCSFEAQSWNPFIRWLRNELHQANLRFSRFLTHSRWTHLCAQVVSWSQSAWRQLFAALPPDLARFFGVTSPTPAKRAPHFSRPGRSRAIVSLRRWLHEPLSTQRRSSRVHNRRSAQ